MEWANIIVTLVVGLISGSLGGSFINWILNIKTTRFNANYERKLVRYYHITTMIELFLHTEEVLNSVTKTIWDVKSVSIEENKSRAWNDLLVNKRQLDLITNNSNVIDAYKNFLNIPDDLSYEKLIQAMKKDLWKS